jgi:hypothetical protein
MLAWPLPPEIVLWVAQLATPLHARHAWRLLPPLRGMVIIAEHAAEQGHAVFAMLRCWLGSSLPGHNAGGR